MAKALQEISKDEFIGWYHSEVTQAILEQVREAKLAFQELLCSEAALGKSIQNARWFGNIEGLDYLLNIKYDREDEIVSEN